MVTLPCRENYHRQNTVLFQMKSLKYGSCAQYPQRKGRTKMSKVSYGSLPVFGSNDVTANWWTQFYDVGFPADAPVTVK